MSNTKFPNNLFGHEWWWKKYVWKRVDVLHPSQNHSFKKLISAKLHTDGDKKYNIVIQVTTIPIVVSIGQDSSIGAATEKAAQNILNTFKTLLLI